MSHSHSDALVFFGATGDLAYKKIFPALQAMLKRDRLDVPVIGVAKAGWNLEQRRCGSERAVGQGVRRGLLVDHRSVAKRRVQLEVESIHGAVSSSEAVEDFIRVDACIRGQ